MKKKMNKKIIWLIVIILLVVLSIAWYVYKEQNNNKLPIVNNTIITNTWVVNELISKNYNNEFHRVTLRWQKLGYMPDICGMVRWTKYADNIWTLDLAANNISAIDKDLSCLKNLSELDLSFNQIDKIDNLDKLTFLSKLDIWNNKLTSIAGLDNLTKLADLHLGYNTIKNTTWLQKLKNLKSLKLQHNEIDNLSWISWLVGLSELKLEFNKLNDSNLAQIWALKQLRILTLAENSISKEIVDKFNEISLSNSSNTGK